MLVYLSEVWHDMTGGSLTISLAAPREPKNDQSCTSTVGYHADIVEMLYDVCFCF